MSLLPLMRKPTHQKLQRKRIPKGTIGAVCISIPGLMAHKVNAPISAASTLRLCLCAQKLLEMTVSRCCMADACVFLLHQAARSKLSSGSAML